MVALHDLMDKIKLLLQIDSVCASFNVQFEFKSLDTDSMDSLSSSRELLPALLSLKQCIHDLCTAITESQNSLSHESIEEVSFDVDVDIDDPVVDDAPLPNITESETVTADVESTNSSQFSCTHGCKDKLDGRALSFASTKSLRMHLAARHGQKRRNSLSGGPAEYKCPLCDVVQMRPAELASHVATCHATTDRTAVSSLLLPPCQQQLPRLYMCRLCHLCCVDVTLLQQHQCRYAERSGVVQRLIACGVLLAWDDELSAVRRFECHQCLGEYRNVDIYRAHAQFCLPPPYSCQLCQLSCSTNPQLVSHILDAHSDESGPLFPCPAPGCGLQFHRFPSYQKHLLRRHPAAGHQSPDQPLTCPFCAKMFVKKIYLTHHQLRYHSELLKREYICEVCGAQLGSSSALNMHVSSVHSDRQYACTLCDKTFTRKDRLQHHVRIHSGEKPHSCPLCPKAFIQRCKLNEHLRRHRGEKRFRCTMCSKQYAANNDLRAHLRRVHSMDLVNKTRTVQPLSACLRPLPDQPDEATPPTTQTPPPTVEVTPPTTQATPLTVDATPTQSSFFYQTPPTTVHLQSLPVQTLSIGHAAVGTNLIIVPANSFFPVI